MNKIIMNTDKTVICHFDERSFEGEVKPDIFEVLVPKEINGVKTDQCKITFNYLTAEKVGNSLLLNNLKLQNQTEVTHNAYSFRVDSLFYCAKGISNCWIEIFDTENEIVIKSDIIAVAIDRHYTVSEYFGEEKNDLINTLLKSFDDTLKEVDEKISSFTSGKSAYEIAVENGYQGTETEWLESINGYSPQKGVDYFTQDDITQFEEYIDGEINTSLIENLESSPLPITCGGTGASTATDACANLGAAAADHIHNTSDITGTLNVENGGTGATTTTAAQAALGVPTTHNCTELSANTSTIINKRYYTDFDTMADAGIYYIPAVNSNYSLMADFEVLNGWLIVIPNKTAPATAVKQIFLRFGTANTNDYMIYARTYIGNSWSTWARFYTTKDTLPIANGGTGAETASDAFRALSGDTDWQTPTFQNIQYWVNDATDINANFKPIQYRKVGKQVFIDGFFKCNDPNNDFSTAGMKALFILPVGYRPTKQIYFRLPMTGTNYAKAYVTPNGAVGLDFTSATTLSTSMWFNFNNVSFFVD